MAAMVLVGSTAMASNSAPTVLDKQGAGVATYAGWAAWSRLDPVTNAYALVLRSPAGVISLAAVAERHSPFDVELGLTASGVTAVYSRCSNTNKLMGCHIYKLALGVTGATEEMLPVPGSSVHEPAIWDGDLVFLRRNPDGGSRRPDNLYEWRIGSAQARSVTLPVSQGLNSGGGRWPRGVTGAITGLTLRGKQIAYATTAASGSFGVVSLWMQGTSGAPRLVDQVTSGASAACEHAFLSPMLLASWLYAYLHDCDPNANPASDRWTRYSLIANTAQQAKVRFVHTGDELIEAVVPDQGGVDWSGERGVERLSSVSWRTIRRPVPETFCSQAHPLC